MVKNYTEVILDEMIAGYMTAEHKAFFACTCESCMDSIKAITLNALKPYYVTCRTGEVFGTFQGKETQNKVDILAELTRAKEMVAHNPHHDKL